MSVEQDVERRIVPQWLRTYQRSWLTRDVVAGVTLAAVAIPEVMGYTAIAGTPIVTGLYTIIFPTLLFALLGSSTLLVVGADSATAAVLASGLTGLGIAGLTAGTAEWLAWTSLVALVCGVLLLLARLLRLGFIGDFLSASVLVGFLSGVGISVLSGQLPAMLGVPKGSGSWFAQQWSTITSLPDASLPTACFALGTVVIVLGCKRYLPKIPGALLAVLLSIVVSSLTHASDHGVAVIGTVTGGFPPIGLPSGVSWHDLPSAVGIAVPCFVLIIAQSAATSRSFAARHGERVDVNRDIVGLSGASFAAGLSGTFVVNGSPTKTQILDDSKGKTQVANMVMSLVALVFVLFLTGLLTNMPQAVLAGIVFLIGVSLIDVAGMKVIFTERRSEFVIAAVTGIAVFAVGVEQGIVLAVVLSLLDIIRRAYRPVDFVIHERGPEGPSYVPATPGTQSLPGLIVFRFDAQMFYANVNRFVDDLKAVVRSAPDPVRWLVLDCSAVDDIDYSAGLALKDLIAFLHQNDIEFGIARADDSLLTTLRGYGVLDDLTTNRMFGSLEELFALYRRRLESDPPHQGP